MVKIRIYYRPQGYVIETKETEHFTTHFNSYGNTFEHVISAVLYSLSLNKQNKTCEIEISEEARDRLGCQTSKTLETIVKHHKLFKGIYRN